MQDYYAEIIEAIENGKPLAAFPKQHLIRLYLMAEYLRGKKTIIINSDNYHNIKKFLDEKGVAIGEICKTGIIVADKMLEKLKKVSE